MNPTFNRRILITAVAAVAIAASAFSTVAMTREPAAASNQPRAYVDASSIQKQVNPAYPRKARLMVYEANCRGNEIGYAAHSDYKPVQGNITYTIAILKLLK